MESPSKKVVAVTPLQRAMRTYIKIALATNVRGEVPQNVSVSNESVTAMQAALEVIIERLTTLYYLIHLFPVLIARATISCIDDGRAEMHPSDIESGLLFLDIDTSMSSEQYLMKHFGPPDVAVVDGTEERPAARVSDHRDPVLLEYVDINTITDDEESFEADTAASSGRSPFPSSPSHPIQPNQLQPIGFNTVPVSSPALSGTLISSPPQPSALQSASALRANRSIEQNIRSFVPNPEHLNMFLFPEVAPNGESFALEIGTPAVPHSQPLPPSTPSISYDTSTSSSGLSTTSTAGPSDSGVSAGHLGSPTATKSKARSPSTPQRSSRSLGPTPERTTRKRNARFSSDSRIANSLAFDDDDDESFFDDTESVDSIEMNAIREGSSNSRRSSSRVASPSSSPAKKESSSNDSVGGSNHSDSSSARCERASKVLLANKWDEKIDPKGYWISEKLDGVRGYWNGHGFYSRQGNLFRAPPSYLELLSHLPEGVCLDGELWAGRGKFQYTVSRVKRHAGDEEDWTHIKYCIFDMPSCDGTYETRISACAEILSALPPNNRLMLVPIRVCEGTEHLNSLLQEVLDKKGEGLMLRKPLSLYEWRRSSTLLKVKRFQDDEALVQGFDSSALVCKLASGIQFRVASGLSKVSPPRIGAVITVRFQELTDNGVPRFPVFDRVRSDLSWEDVLIEYKKKQANDNPLTPDSGAPLLFHKTFSALSESEASFGKTLEETLSDQIASANRYFHEAMPHELEDSAVDAAPPLATPGEFHSITSQSSTSAILSPPSSSINSADVAKREQLSIEEISQHISRLRISGVDDDGDSDSRSLVDF